VELTKVILEFTLIPVGRIGTSASDLIAEALKVVEDSNISYQVTPMATIIEGDNLEHLLSIVRKAHERLFEIGIKRVITSILIDDRRDVERDMKKKVTSVMNKLKKGEN